MDSVVLRQHCHLRVVLLEDHGGGGHREGFPIDGGRERDLGIGAGPERPVLVVDLEHGGRGARIDLESAGNVEELGRPLSFGYLRHREIRGHAWFEKGTEPFRHVHEEAQPIDHSDSKEVSFRVRGAECALLTDQVADVDVTLNHDAVKRSDDLFELDERPDVFDLLLRGLQQGRMGLHLFFFHCDGLFRDRVGFAHSLDTVWR